MIDTSNTQQVETVSMIPTMRRDIVGYGSLCPNKRDTSSFRVVNDNVQDVKSYVEDNENIQKEKENAYEKVDLMPLLIRNTFINTDTISDSLSLVRTEESTKTCNTNVKQDDTVANDFVKPTLLRRSGKILKNDCIRTILPLVDGNYVGFKKMDEGNSNNTILQTNKERSFALHHMLTEAIQISES
jgi:hypothetical protein